MNSTISIPAGHALTVTANAASSGTVTRVGDDGKPDTPTPVAASNVVVIGPFAVSRVYRVTSLVGALTATTAIVEAGAALANVGVPTTFTATGAGAVTVTSAAAGDLVTTSARVATLVAEVQALTNAFNTLLARLRARGDIQS